MNQDMATSLTKTTHNLNLPSMWKEQRGTHSGPLSSQGSRFLTTLLGSGLSSAHSANDSQSKSSADQHTAGGLAFDAMIAGQETQGIWATPLNLSIKAWQIAGLGTCAVPAP